MLKITYICPVKLSYTIIFISPSIIFNMICYYDTRLTNYAKRLGEVYVFTVVRALSRQSLIRSLFCHSQHRCVSVFIDKRTNQPTGFALGSIEGRVAIHYANPQNPKDNFTFKCHRSNGSAGNVQDIYAVSRESSIRFSLGLKTTRN